MTIQQIIAELNNIKEQAVNHTDIGKDSILEINLSNAQNKPFKKNDLKFAWNRDGISYDETSDRELNLLGKVS